VMLGPSLCSFQGATLKDRSFKTKQKPKRTPTDIFFIP